MLNYYRNCYFVEKCDPQFWFGMFIFGPITIDMFSCLCGPEVTQQTVVPEVQGSISGSDNDFFVWFVVVFLHFWSKTVIC